MKEELCREKIPVKKNLANILEQSVKRPMTGDNSLKEKANGEQRDGI
jgi:hypothetical protein